MTAYQQTIPTLSVPVPDWLYRRASQAGWHRWRWISGVSGAWVDAEDEAEVRRLAGLSGRSPMPRVGLNCDESEEETT